MCCVGVSECVVAGGGMDSDSLWASLSSSSVSGVLRRLRRLRLKICPSSVLTVNERGATSWRTVALVFHPPGSSIRTVSLLDSGGRCFAALS